MLPERRLEALVEQALWAQLSRCLYHNAPRALPSLLTDYSCGREQVPTVTTQVRDGQLLMWAAWYGPSWYWQSRGVVLAEHRM